MKRRRWSPPVEPRPWTMTDREAREFAKRHEGDSCVCGHLRLEHTGQTGSLTGCKAKGCTACFNYALASA